MNFDEAQVRDALEKAWSLETAKQWSPENPANGQCNVTAAKERFVRYPVIGRINLKVSFFRVPT